MAPAGVPDGWDIADADWTPDEAATWLAGAIALPGPQLPYVSARELIATTPAPVYVVDGILQERHVCALTARTNHGKTAIAVTLALAVCAGVSFGYAKCAQGNVLYLCGEDSYGFAQRIPAAIDALELSHAVLDAFHIVPESFQLRNEVERFVKRFVKPYKLVVVDTSVSYFHGDKEDDNVQARDHALALRELTNLPGKPAVLVCCHPTKAATADTMTPRGGSAFLNEIDCNLGVWKSESRVTVGWHQKKRGPDFDELSFELVERLITDDPFRIGTVGTTGTNRGTTGTTIVAVAIDSAREVTLAREEDDKQLRLLRVLNAARQSMSVADIARSGGFVSTTGEPQKSTVHRILMDLDKFKLVSRKRSGWQITTAGRDEI
jgi:hypothetical protein